MFSHLRIYQRSERKYLPTMVHQKRPAKPKLIKKRGRPIHKPEVEQYALEWIQKARKQGMAIKTKQIIAVVLLKDANFYDGDMTKLKSWVYRFLKRSNLSPRALKNHRQHSTAAVYSTTPSFCSSVMLLTLWNWLCGLWNRGTILLSVGRKNVNGRRVSRKKSKILKYQPCMEENVVRDVEDSLAPAAIPATNQPKIEGILSDVEDNLDIEDSFVSAVLSRYETTSHPDVENIEDDVVPDDVFSENQHIAEDKFIEYDGTSSKKPSKRKRDLMELEESTLAMERLKKPKHDRTIKKSLKRKREMMETDDGSSLKKARSVYRWCKMRKRDRLNVEFLL